MCNIAGYVGTRAAAPILIEMMRREEGFNGGYYTGIATIADGKIYMEKVVGDLQTLLDQTPAANCPGTTGFIHSRSKSGGDVEWGHPFMGSGDKIAYIANGASGVFRERFASAQTEAYLSLLKDGYRFRSRVEGGVGEYQRQPDGSCVHGSDIKCQQIAKAVDDGLETWAAIEKAFCEVAGEIVGLVLNVNEPDRISWGRINFPMFAGIADHGIYLASTPHAFPADAKKIMQLSTMACGTVYADRIETKFFSDPPGTINEVDAQLWRACSEALCKAISEKEMDCEEIDEVLLPLFTGADCSPYPAVEYEILYDLQKQGKLNISVSYEEGSQAGLLAPKFKMSLK